MKMIVKICKKHGELTEEQVSKEKNKNLKNGYQLRCQECRRDKDRVYKMNNPDKHKDTANRARDEARRLYREGLTNVRSKADIWAKQDRINNLDKYRENELRRRKREGQLRNIKEVCRRVNAKVDDYYEMLNNQNNKCAICNKEETRKSRTDGKICALTIDHNHSTGNIRELLCHNCNVLVGHSKESIDILERTIEYIKKHNCN